MGKIDFHQKLEGKKQAVFIILYAVGGKPWANYGVKSAVEDLEIPTCVMINRSDGRIGFAGGHVNDEETLEEAIKREVEEEIGYKLCSDLEPLVAHDMGTITTHVFATQLPYRDVRNIQKDAHLAELTEICQRSGYCLEDLLS